MKCLRRAEFLDSNKLSFFWFKVFVNRVEIFFNLAELHRLFCKEEGGGGWSSNISVILIFVKGGGKGSGEGRGYLPAAAPK